MFDLFSSKDYFRFLIVASFVFTIASIRCFLLRVHVCVQSYQNLVKILIEMRFVGTRHAPFTSCLAIIFFGVKLDYPCGFTDVDLKLNVI